MSAIARAPEPARPIFEASTPGRALETAGAWLLGILWATPLLYAVWTAFHGSEFAVHFDLLAPLTLKNFARAWDAAPFARYFLNSFILVSSVLAAQLVLSTLAAFAFARFDFIGRDLLFMLVLVQLMIMPDVLIVENYRTMKALGLVDSILGIGLPYMASAFGIFLLRQTFKSVPKELDEAARVLTGSTRDDEDLTLRIPSDGGAKSLRDLLNRLDEHSIDVEEFSVHTPDLDDVFLALTGHASTEENAR